MFLGSSTDSLLTQQACDKLAKDAPQPTGPHLAGPPTFPKPNAVGGLSTVQPAQVVKFRPSPGHRLLRPRALPRHWLFLSRPAHRGSSPAPLTFHLLTFRSSQKSQSSPTGEGKRYSVTTSKYWWTCLSITATMVTD